MSLELKVNFNCFNKKWKLSGKPWQGEVDNMLRNKIKKSYKAKNKK